MSGIYNETNDTGTNPGNTKIQKNVWSLKPDNTWAPRAYDSFPYGNAATTNLVVVHSVSHGDGTKRRRPDNTYQHSSNSCPNFI